MVNSRDIDQPKDSASDRPQVCRIVESVRRWMVLGTTAGDVRELELDESTLKAICEYARLDDDHASTADAVAAMLKILLDETKQVDIELEMLGLRRRALSNRATLLRKLASALEP